MGTWLLDNWVIGGSCCFKCIAVSVTSQTQCCDKSDKANCRLTSPCFKEAPDISEKLFFPPQNFCH